MWMVGFVCVCVRVCSNTVMSVKIEGYFCPQECAHMARGTRECTILWTRQQSHMFRGVWLRTWPLGTFWADLVCPGSFVSWTIAALVFLSSRSSYKGLLLQTENSTKRSDSVISRWHTRIRLWFCMEGCSDNYLIGVFGNVTVVGLQCGAVWGLEPHSVFNPEQRGQRRGHNPASIKW